MESRKFFTEEGKVLCLIQDKPIGYVAESSAIFIYFSPMVLQIEIGSIATLYDTINGNLTLY